MIHAIRSRRADGTPLVSLRLKCDVCGAFSIPVYCGRSDPVRLDMTIDNLRTFAEVHESWSQRLVVRAEDDAPIRGDVCHRHAAPAPSKPARRRPWRWPRR